MQEKSKYIFYIFTSLSETQYIQGHAEEKFQAGMLTLMRQDLMKQGQQG